MNFHLPNRRKICKKTKKIYKHLNHENIFKFSIFYRGTNICICLQSGQLRSGRHFYTVNSARVRSVPTAQPAQYADVYKSNPDCTDDTAGTASIPLARLRTRILTQHKLRQCTRTGRQPVLHKDTEYRNKRLVGGDRTGGS